MCLCLEKQHLWSKVVTDCHFYTLMCAVIVFWPQEQFCPVLVSVLLYRFGKTRGFWWRVFCEWSWSEGNVQSVFWSCSLYRTQQQQTLNSAISAAWSPTGESYPTDIGADLCFAICTWAICCSRNCDWFMCHDTYQEFCLLWFNTSHLIQRKEWNSETCLNNTLPRTFKTHVYKLFVF